jgi:hypothetical protein
MPEISGNVLDPCVGDGAISNWIENMFDMKRINLFTNDIDKKRKALFHFDARKPVLYERVMPDWTIANFAFDVIDELITTALSGSCNLITLARLSVLEPTKARRAIYQYYQPDMLIVLPRYCFRLNDDGKRSTDSVTCAWVGWGPEVPRITTVWTEPPPEEKKDKKR